MPMLLIYFKIICRIGAAAKLRGVTSLFNKIANIVLNSISNRFMLYIRELSFSLNKASFSDRLSKNNRITPKTKAGDVSNNKYY